jgi:hypothetical protein
MFFQEAKALFDSRHFPAEAFIKYLLALNGQQIIVLPKTEIKRSR